MTTQTRNEIPDDVRKVPRDDDPIQTWGTEFEEYEVYNAPETGQVIVEHYVFLDGEWSHAGRRVQHITDIGK